MELVIAEKPSVAQSIAAVLGACLLYTSIMNTKPEESVQKEDAI